MSGLIQQIVQCCQQNPLEEKWLFAPNLRIGWQWIDAASRSGAALVNLHCKTIQRTVLDEITPYMLQRGLRFASRWHGVLLVESVWRSLEQENYFHEMKPNRALFESLYQSLNDLRMSGSTQLDDSKFETPSKARTIQFMLEQYSRLLNEAKLIDYSEALRIANGEVQANEELMLLLPEDIDLNRAEMQFLQTLSSNQIQILDEPTTLKPQRDIELLSSINKPIEAAESYHDGSVNLFHAMGEANEVREVFRRILQQQIPLDHVEIVCTDSDAYVPLLYELSFEPRWTESSQMDPLPMTFADGIPLRYSKPGEALRLWIQWMRQDFLQPLLIALYQDQLIKSNEATFSHADLAQALRELPIGFGRKRTLSCIEQHLQSLRSHLKSISALSADDVEPDLEKAKTERGIQLFQTLHDEVGALLKVTPDEGAPIDRLFEKALLFCERHLPEETEFDAQSRNVLIRELKRLLETLHDYPQASGIDGWELLESMPSQLTVLGSGPQPGHVHVSHYMTGGHSSRPHVFLIGMDDGRFPGAGSQDPVLLDSERKLLSDGLATSGYRIQQKIETMRRILKRLRGNVTIGFSSYDVIDGREQFASPLVLAIHRLIGGEQHADYSSLSQALGQAASFAPSGEKQCANERDFDFLCAANNENQSIENLYKRFPHFQDGENAMRQRASNRFTEYDGFVQEAGPFLNFTAGRTASASALERLGQCPLAYFFRYGLYLEEPVSNEIDNERWLDALAFGSLVHELFEGFIAKRIKQNITGPILESKQEMMKLAGQKIQQYRELYPPKSVHLFERQREQIVYCAECFLQSEAELQTEYSPQFVEARIGYQSETDDALSYPLEDGSEIKVRGVIDRIDLIGDSTAAKYAIWDYKTGGTRKYKERRQEKKWDSMQQGRVIQHALYTAIARDWLRQHASSDAQVVRFGYFFPSPKGNGERLVWGAEELTQLGNVLFRLNQIASMGAFLPTQDADDCRFCEFQPICGDVVAQAERSEEKLLNQQNDRLAPMKELRFNEC
ncbi:PD-(D/E)XK nuclease family protein [bacterium]|nr:PD-(D/E)XK nuclease family protein [bacterium]